MTISTEQLLKLISGMTDQKPDIVLEEWETLVDSVRNLKPGESVEMSQLGTFKNVKGEIEFNPNAELADEINYEYSGQEPVVIEEGEEGSTVPIGVSVSGDDDEAATAKDDADDDDAFGVGFADDKANAEDSDDDFINPFVRKGSEPLFPDVDEVARKIKEDEDAEAAAKAENQDDIFGLDDENDTPSTLDKSFEEEKTESESISAADRDDEAITQPKNDYKKDDDDLTDSDSTNTEEKPLFESLESPEDEEKPAAMVIPPVKPDENVLKELKAEEEAAKAEAMARKIEKEQGKREKAKQVKKFNVWVAPTKTKSRANPQQLAKVGGLIFLSVLVVGGLIWYLLSMSGSGDRPVTTQQAVQPAVTEEQPIAEIPPAAEEEVVTEEVTPQDATEPVPADQTQEEPAAELIPEPQDIAPDPVPEPEPVLETTPEPEPESATTPTPAPPVTEPATGEYGLEGEISIVSGRSYGIVVYSLSNQNRAQQEQATLRDLGYRTLIIPHEQDGQTFYRVLVGQLETPEAAVEAGQQLPEPYRNSFFVRRFFP